MSLDLAIRSFEILLALSLIVQTTEYLVLARRQDVHAVWMWSVQKGDLQHSHRIVGLIFNLLYRDEIHILHLSLRLICAISFIWGVTLVSSLFIFFSTIVLLIRWRGAFNGGSDFMTVVAVTGLVIAMVATEFVDKERAWNVALWYVAIHSITSYFMSGAVKLLNSHWRNGGALIYFLDRGLYGPLSEYSLFKRPVIAILASWSFIIWEILFPLVLFDEVIAVAFVITAFGFHLLVFRFFGLNRFVWAWVVTFPAIIYCSNSL